MKLPLGLEHNSVVYELRRKSYRAALRLLLRAAVRGLVLGLAVRGAIGFFHHPRHV